MIFTPFLPIFSISSRQERVGDRTLIYDYKLFWWRFQPGANLVKAAETNLFADADSNRTHMQELVLYVCEWGNSDYILVRRELRGGITVRLFVLRHFLLTSRFPFGVAFSLFPTLFSGVRLSLVFDQSSFPRHKREFRRNGRQSVSRDHSGQTITRSLRRMRQG